MLYPEIFALMLNQSLPEWLPTLHGLLIFGVMSREQIHRLFWEGRSLDAVDQAMEYLSESGVVDRVEIEGGELKELAEVGIPCSVIYGLSDSGKMLIAELSAVWLYGQN